MSEQQGERKFQPRERGFPPRERGFPPRERGFGERGPRREGGEGGRRGRGPPRGPKRDSDKEWIPVTKLGRLVRDKKIQTLEEIFVHSHPIKEYQIIDLFLKSKLKDEVMKISPVQKQTTAGQRTRFKAYVAIGDNERHAGLGIKCSAEVATAIRGAIILAKLSLIPVRLGYWGNRFAAPHTVPCKVTGKCGSVRIRLIPAPRGTGIVASPVSRKILELAGVHDVFTSTSGHTKTLGNFVQATIDALRHTYGFLTPDFWESRDLPPSPYQAYSEYLTKKEEKTVTAEKKFY